jgi:hypothetical protein
MTFGRTKGEKGMSHQTFEFRPPSEDWYAAALEVEQNYTGEISAGIPITHPEEFVSGVPKFVRGSKGLSLFAIGFGIAALSGLILAKLIGTKDEEEECSPARAYRLGRQGAAAAGYPASAPVREKSSSNVVHGRE